MDLDLDRPRFNPHQRNRSDSSKHAANVRARCDANRSRNECRGLPSPLVGFNPFRQQDKSTLDLALVVGFVVLTLAAVAWGFCG